MYFPGSSFSRTFITNTTAQPIIPFDPNKAPGASLVRNGVADLSAVPVVTKIQTGEYLASGTIPITYASGDTVELTARWVPQQGGVDELVISHDVLASGGYAGGGTLWFTFVTRSPVDPFASQSVTGMSGSLVRNGVVDGAVSVAITSVFLLTGEYLATAVIPGTYAVGDDIQLLVSYTSSAQSILQSFSLGQIVAHSTVLPIVQYTVVLGTPYQTVVPISLFQNAAATICWNFVDASDAPVSLAGKSITLAAWQSADGGVTKQDLFTKTTGSGITIVNSGNNGVQVAFAQVDTVNLFNEAVGYDIADVTDETVIASGPLSIVPASQ